MLSSLVAQADMPVVRNYATWIMGPIDQTIIRYRLINAGSGASRAHQRMPSASHKAELYRRDGWRCRYCGCPVVPTAARDRLWNLLPDAISISSKARDYHAAFLALNAVPDHANPHSAGGSNDMDNIVTACLPRNFGKGAYSLEQLGLLDPRSRPPTRDEWDGLQSVFDCDVKPMTVPQPRAAKFANCNKSGDVRSFHPTIIDSETTSRSTAK